MGIKRGIGFVLFLIAIGFIFAGTFSVTGNIISQRYPILTVNIIGVFLLLISLLLMTSKKSLEAIVIPTGEKSENNERARVGLDYYSKKGNPENYFIITGGRYGMRDPKREEIYKELRGAGYTGKTGEGPEIKPSQMIVESHSRDTLDNVIYSLKKLRPGTRQIDFVSYPLHLSRIKLIMKKAKKEGLAPDWLKVKYVPTSQNVFEFFYGIIGLIEERYRLRHGIREAQKHSPGKFGNLVKRLLGG